MRLALFDLDHTLLPVDSNHLWHQFEASRGVGDPQRRNQQYLYHMHQYMAEKFDIVAYNNFCLEFVIQETPQSFAALSQEFITDFVQPHIKPAALELLAQHRHQGDRVIIITATNQVITQPIAKAFGVDDLIAVEIETDATTGWFNGNIKGQPSYREGKVIRLEQWLQQHNKDWQDVEYSSFYSDSINDLALLEKVNNPVAVNPDDSLRQLAQQRNWPILDLFGKA